MTVTRRTYREMRHPPGGETDSLSERVEDSCCGFRHDAEDEQVGMSQAEKPGRVGERRLVRGVPARTPGMTALAASDVLDEPPVTADHRLEMCFLLVDPGLSTGIQETSPPNLGFPSQRND